MINIINLRKGVERLFWQSEWFDIKFSDLHCELSLTSLASSEFYDIFYKKLFEKYHSIGQLPWKWRNEKLQTATQLNCLIPSNSRVLSVGCGLGFIEQFLLQSRGDISLVASDYSEAIFRWIKIQFPSLNYASVIPMEVTFDCIYLCQVLYALSFDDAVNLLKSLKKIMSDDAQLILINTSVFPWENKEYSRPLKWLLMFRWLLSSLRRNFIIFDRAKDQLWGWERDLKMFEKITNAAGMRLVRKWPAANQQFLILKT